MANTEISNRYTLIRDHILRIWDNDPSEILKKMNIIDEEGQVHDPARLFKAVETIESMKRAKEEESD